MPAVLSKLLINTDNSKVDCLATYEDFLKLCEQGDNFFNNCPQNIEKALEAYMKAIGKFKLLPDKKLLRSAIRKKGASLSLFQCKMSLK